MTLPWEGGTLLDGLPDGVGEWKNVQYSVRRAFAALFAEVGEGSCAKQELDAVADHVERLEGNVARLTRTVAAMQKTLAAREGAAAVADEATRAKAARRAEAAEVSRAAGIRALQDELRDAAAASAATERSLRALERRTEALPSTKSVEELLERRTGEVSFGAALMTAQNAAQQSFPVAKWSAKGATLGVHKRSGAVEWTRRELVCGDCRCFDWNGKAAPHDVYAVSEGVYEVVAAVFSDAVSRMALRVNSDEVLVSRSTAQFISSKGMHTGCSVKQCAKMCVSGQTFTHLLWLPAHARLSLTIEPDAANMPSARVLDAIMMLRYIG